MSLEQDNSQMEKPMQRITPDGMEERSENIGDTGRENFELRRSQQSFRPERQNHIVTDSVRNKILMHKKQVRNFSAHKAQSTDEQRNELIEDILSIKNAVSDSASESDETSEKSDDELSSDNDTDDDERVDDTASKRDCSKSEQSHHNSDDETENNQSANHGETSQDPKSHTENSDSDATGETADSSESTENNKTADTDGKQKKAQDKPGNGNEKNDINPGKNKPSLNEAEAVPLGNAALKAKAKAEKSEKKLDKARENLPQKYRVKYEKSFDKESGKPKRRLHFEGEAKSQSEHIKGAKATRPVKKGVNSAITYGHKKIYEVEHENVGTQAAHKGEILVERGIQKIHHNHKTAPYRRLQKLEVKTDKLKVKAVLNPEWRRNER